MKRFIGLGIVATTLLLGSCTSTADGFLARAQAAYQVQNYHASFEMMQKAAIMRSARAQYALGYMYYYGIGVQANLPQALYWMQKAAKQHEVSALLVLPKLEAMVPNVLFVPHHTMPLQLPKP